MLLYVFENIIYVGEFELGRWGNVKTVFQFWAAFLQQRVIFYRSLDCFNIIGAAKISVLDRTQKEKSSKNRRAWSIPYNLPPGNFSRPGTGELRNPSESVPHIADK